MKPKIRIVIADDHPVFRYGLESIINNEKELEVIGSAENGLIAVELVKELKPDIVILDIKMPVLDGIEAARKIQAKFPNIKIVFLTFEIDGNTIGSLKEFVAKGYLLKDSNVEEIITCLKYAAQNRTYMSPEILDLFMKTVVEPNSGKAQAEIIAGLTPTETRILRLIALEKTNKEIAQELYISIHTCTKHRSNLSKKFNLKGNHSLLRFVVRNKGLILQA